MKPERVDITRRLDDPADGHIEADSLSSPAFRSARSPEGLPRTHSSEESSFVRTHGAVVRSREELPWEY
jgi:hypothetical protein